MAHAPESIQQIEERHERESVKRGTHAHFSGRTSSSSVSSRDESDPPQPAPGHCDTSTARASWKAERMKKLPRRFSCLNTARRRDTTCHGTGGLRGSE